MPALSERGLRSGEWCSSVEQSLGRAPHMVPEQSVGFSMIIATLQLAATRQRYRGTAGDK